MDEAFQKNLLLELECPICTQYMAPPIRQCNTGHSICERCLGKLRECPLCQSEFSQARNLSLESLAARLQYPCSNAGCPVKLTLTNRDYHEKTCNFRNYKCPMENCGWTGSLQDITKHWDEKKLCKSYKNHNLCHTKLTTNMFFVNLIEAYNDKFWYKCKIINGFLFFAVQFIGQADQSETYCYEIEIFKPGHLKRKLILGDYCQSIHLNDDDLFKKGGTAYISIDSLNNFIGIDKLIIYHLRVSHVGGKSKQPNEPRQEMKHASSNPFLDSCSDPPKPNISKQRHQYNKRGGKK